MTQIDTHSTHPTDARPAVHRRRPVKRPSAPGPRARRNGLPYAFLVPATLALAVALGYPLARQVVLSFQDFGLAQQFGRPPEWVGLDNYLALAGDPYLWTVVGRPAALDLAPPSLHAGSPGVVDADGTSSTLRTSAGWTRRCRGVSAMRRIKEPESRSRCRALTPVVPGPRRWTHMTCRSSPRT